MTHFSRAALAFLALTVFAGCGKPAPKLVPFRGTLHANKQPVVGAILQFAADIGKGDHTLDAYGQTDAAGAFTLKTPQHGEGVVAGHYKVVVTPAEGGRGVPARYRELGTTPLFVQVPEGGKTDWAQDLAEPKP